MLAGPIADKDGGKVTLAAIIVIGMHPNIRRDLPRLGEPNHVHGRRPMTKSGGGFRRLGRWVDSRGCRVSINAIKIGGRMYPVGL